MPYRSPQLALRAIGSRRGDFVTRHVNRCVVNARMLFSFLRSPGLWCSVALLGAATTTAPAQTATPNVSPYEHVPNTAAHVAMMPSGSSFASLTGALVTNVELRGI